MYPLRDDLYQERTEGDFVNPASTIMMTDSSSPFSPIPPGWGDPGRHPSFFALLNTDVCGKYGTEGPDGHPYRGLVSLRHSGGFNALFADGHVKRLTRTTWDMWAFDPKLMPEEEKTIGCG